MQHQNFQYSFISTKKANEVFDFLINPENWWMGIYGETIEGNSQNLNDEFSFKAGGGMHYSNQKLLAFETNKKVVWLVTESNLSFLENTNEWTGTKICFELEQQDKDSIKITFTHDGLIPQIECYDQCTNGWTKYLENLKECFK